MMASSVQPTEPWAYDPTGKAFDFEARTCPITAPRITSPIWTGGMYDLVSDRVLGE